jgi:hypothetical protein
MINTKLGKKKVRLDMFLFLFRPVGVGTDNSDVSRKAYHRWSMDKIGALACVSSPVFWIVYA